MAVCTARTAPISPILTSSMVRRHCGWKRYMKASIRRTPFFRQCSRQAWACPASKASGFSQSTCFPASALLRSHSACRWLGRAMNTASRLRSATRSS